MTEHYSIDTVEWIIKNLPELRQGIWPDSITGEKVPGKKVGHHATFESPAGLAGFVESKLSKCGRDGLMVKVYFVLGEPDSVLADIARCPIEEVGQRIRRVLLYVAGTVRT